MNQLVLASLLPVVLLIAMGFIAGRAGWIRPTAVKDLSNLIFLLLAPALLFRTMSKVHVEQLNFRPLLAYFLGAAVLFVGILVLKGLTRRGAVLALAGTYSNTTMIGIALIGLMYGPDALVILLTLVSLHALILLTSATVVLELAVAREEKQALAERTGVDASVTAMPPRHPVATVLNALKNSVINPVPLPIIVGLMFAQTGLTLPAIIDRPLELLGNSFSPLALVMVGITLASTSLGKHWQPALVLAAVKNLVHPLLVFALCMLFGVTGLPRTVMIVAAAMPIGANVFMFSQRYQVAEELITASVVVSTVLAMATLTMVMLLVH